MVNGQQLKDKARELGIDLVGVAPVERFGQVDVEEHPCAISPATKSVIVLGFQIPRGALRGIEEGTAWHTMTAGSPVHPMIQAELTYLLCRWLEMLGWEATPLFHHPQEMKRQGIPVRRDKPAPDVILNMEFAAHVAGLGGIGLGKFFLTREFGPRQVFCAILTDAELDRYDAVSETVVCDQCGECIRACPAEAYATSETTTAVLCNATVAWRTLKIEHCLVCNTGKSPNPYIDHAEPCRIGAACGRACVAHLEDHGKLSRTFVNKFRDHERGGVCSHAHL